MLTAQLKQHICAEGGVGLHNLELLGRQASGLVENRIVDRHLADIVQRRGHSNRGTLLIVERELVAVMHQAAQQQLGQLFDMRDVQAALAVAELHDAGHDIDQHAAVLNARVVLLRQQVCQATLLGIQADGVTHAAAHDARIKRAVDIVRSAQLVGAQHHVVGIFTRDHDDGQVIGGRPARQVSQHLKAAHARHDNVEQHKRQLITITVNHIERRAAVVSLQDVILVLEHLVEDNTVHLGVIDNKDRGLLALEGLDCIGVSHDRTGLCLGMAQQLDRAAYALVDRLAIDVNTAHACRKAYMLVAGDNRGVNGIGYMAQATRKVIGGDIGHDDRTYR